MIYSQGRVIRSWPRVPICPLFLVVCFPETYFYFIFWGILNSDVFMGFPWLYGLFASESPTSVENTRIMEQEILKYMYKLKTDLIDSLSSWSWFSPIKVHRDFLPITISPNQFQNIGLCHILLKIRISDKIWLIFCCIGAFDHMGLFLYHATEEVWGSDMNSHGLKFKIKLPYIFLIISLHLLQHWQCQWGDCQKNTICEKEKVSNFYTS